MSASQPAPILDTKERQVSHILNPLNGINLK